MKNQKKFLAKDERLSWVNEKVNACRKIALAYFGKPMKVQRKADRSPVTIVDCKIEEFLRREITKAFPQEAIIGEEFGSKTVEGKTFWTIDPIDGTRAFSRGLPSWGTLVGFVKDGKPVLGVCDFPSANTRLCVGERSSAYEESNGARKLLLKASPAPALSDSVVFHGGSSWWFESPYAEGFRKIACSCFLERAYGDCYAYLWLFRGCADVMLDYGVKIWDLAPFAALARSTGRVMLNCFGKVSFTGPGTILSDPAFAKKIARIIDNSRSL
jgi:fructose-1,6-bisphosphatase/inositol monophosphatase family enzyme